MMPLSLFASRPFIGLTVLTFLLYGALGGLLVLLPYLLIVGGAYSPIQAGLALLPFFDRDRRGLAPDGAICRDCFGVCKRRRWLAGECKKRAADDNLYRQVIGRVAHLG